MFKQITDFIDHPYLIQKIHSTYFTFTYYQHVHISFSMVFITVVISFYFWFVFGKWLSNRSYNSITKQTGVYTFDKYCGLSVAVSFGETFTNSSLVLQMFVHLEKSHRHKCFWNKSCSVTVNAIFDNYLSLSVIVFSFCTTWASSYHLQMLIHLEKVTIYTDVLGSKAVTLHVIVGINYHHINLMQ
jgi:hypothetical protein